MRDWWGIGIVGLLLQFALETTLPNTESGLSLATNMSELLLQLLAFELALKPTSLLFNSLRLSLSFQKSKHCFNYKFKCTYIYMVQGHLEVKWLSGHYRQWLARWPVGWRSAWLSLQSQSAYVLLNICNKTSNCCWSLVWLVLGVQQKQHEML